MERDLIIDVASSEVTIALLEDKFLIGINKENSTNGFSVGDIYLGKVKRLMPALNAAFVDIGDEKDAFIHYLDLGLHFKAIDQFTKQAVGKKGKVSMSDIKLKDILKKEGKISEVLTVGQPILVQVVKEAISTKGPRLTSDVSIAGRNMVLIPFADKVHISQKIGSTEEKRRLNRIIKSILPKGYGVIIRTASEGQKTATLAPELESLIRRWEACTEKLRAEKAPQLLMSEISRTSVILRDMLNGSFNHIHINDEALYKEVKDYVSMIAPGKEKIVRHYTGSAPIFEYFDVSKQIRGTFGKHVSLKKGAYLVIEQTEALHVIDVNSGRTKGEKDQESHAFEVNMVAAEEVVRQLRLRDIGGIIVVDFIDMDKVEHRNALYKRMQELMEADRSKHHVLPLSKFGLMQITRQRVRQATTINITEQCPACKGSGKVLPVLFIDEEIEAQLAYLTGERNITQLTLKTHPFMAAFLSIGWLASKRRKWAKKYKCRLRVMPMSTYSYLDYHWFDKNDEQIMMD